MLPAISLEHADEPSAVAFQHLLLIVYQYTQRDRPINHSSPRLFNTSRMRSPSRWAGVRVRGQSRRSDARSPDTSKARLGVVHERDACVLAQPLRAGQVQARSGRIGSTPTPSSKMLSDPKNLTSALRDLLFCRPRIRASRARAHRSHRAGAESGRRPTTIRAPWSDSANCQNDRGDPFRAGEAAATTLDPQRWRDIAHSVRRGQGG